MVDIKNTEVLGTILKSTLGVISRRTSEPYANMIIDKILNNLSKKYDFLKNVKLEKDRYQEIVNLIDIDDKINNVDFKTIGNAIKDLMISLANLMGKDAGFYFIKEIKEDIPYNYEIKINKAGVDLELIQSEFITEIKSSYRYKIENSEVVKYIFKLLYQILEDDFGKKYSYVTLNEMVNRLSTQYDILKFVKINDVRSIQNVDIISVDKKINTIDSKEVGSSIQKIVQEISQNVSKEKSFSLIEKLNESISADYCIKLKEMGVNFEIIKLKQTKLVKNILKTLIDILSKSSSESYAVMIIDNIIKKYSEKYEFLKNIEIDSINLSQGEEAIKLPEDFEKIRPSELGRAIQRIMEKVSTSMGDIAGNTFLDNFKQRVGKAYLLRMEEIGVNLHMIELRRDFL